MSGKLRTTAFALLLATLFATTANALPREARLSLPLSDSGFVTVFWDWMTSLFAAGPQEKEGSSMDPDGQPVPAAGSQMDPNGDPTTEAGGDMDPNGVK
ncbi:MAG TPA: hypothetical protein VLT87_25635 [Thermoanaerobaculia bacterium]|nr:hypothetical protein [Thermoanaerobaculia bacterium]